MSVHIVVANLIEPLTYPYNLVSASSSWAPPTTFISMDVHFLSALNMPPPLGLYHSTVPVRPYYLFPSPVLRAFLQPLMN